MSSPSFVILGSHTPQERTADTGVSLRPTQGVWESTSITNSLTEKAYRHFMDSESPGLPTHLKT